jgi:hypothetical protein
MSSITPIEKRYFENLFGMSSGYVLDFTNNSFAQFFIDTVGIDIYDDRYSFNSGSKANRLRAFWEVESDPLAGKILSELLEFWRLLNVENQDATKKPEYIHCRRIANRLLGKSSEEPHFEDDFLTHDFGDINIKQLNIDPAIIPIIESRIKEANNCLKHELSLSVIFLCGSVLEGLLLAVASKNPKTFNLCSKSPKNKDGKVRPFNEWTLANFIDVACEIELLGLDVKQFCHILRDFRNYIHPNQQRLSNFHPDSHTAKICMQVLKAAIADLNNNKLGRNVRYY